MKFSTCYSDTPADHGSEVLPVTPGVDPSLELSEHGPSLVGGTTTLDDASFKKKTRFTAELAFLHRMVAWRFWTLAIDFHSARCWGSHAFG